MWPVALLVPSRFVTPVFAAAVVPPPLTLLAPGAPPLASLSVHLFIVAATIVAATMAVPAVSAVAPVAPVTVPRTVRA